MPSDCGYIYDGYTRKGYIKAQQGFYPELRFAYRPWLSTTYSAVLRMLNERAPEYLPVEQAELKISELLHDAIDSWSLADREGNPVELSVANLLRVEPKLRLRLRDIVAGYAPSDPDPKASPDEAGFSGKSPEELAKNSTAA